MISIIASLLTPALVLSAQATIDPDLTPKVEAVMKRRGHALRAKANGLKAVITPLEEVKGLVDYPEHTIETLPAMELMKAHVLKYQPWSGHTWALRHGQIARRFGDGGFPASDDWKTNYDYTHIFAPPGVLANQGMINALSPAEKYDLLIDPSRSFRFTDVNWEEGGKYFRQDGKVEGWMGICHGTTAGGIMALRPAHAVDLIAADGVTRIRFNPSDIKALASVFWAYVPYNARFAGLRCNVKKEDLPRGRITSPECFDTNAGAFHLGMVNQIGLFKGPLVMDRSPHVEVWNHTIYGYNFEYFNPKTKKEVNHFTDALIRRDQWSNDPYAAYRSPAAKYIIGVRNFVNYRVSTAATTRATAPAEAGNTAKYVYDLELDENLRVIGGEWYTDNFPDFLWRPSPTEPALADAEKGLTSDWDISSPLPEEWQVAAQSAVGQKIPLGKIVEKLVAASRSRNGNVTEE